MNQRPSIQGTVLGTPPVRLPWHVPCLESEMVLRAHGLAPGDALFQTQNARHPPGVVGIGLLSGLSAEAELEVDQIPDKLVVLDLDSAARQGQRQILGHHTVAVEVQPVDRFCLAKGYVPLITRDPSRLCLLVQLEGDTGRSPTKAKIRINPGAVGEAEMVSHDQLIRRFGDDFDCGLHVIQLGILPGRSWHERHQIQVVLVNVPTSFAWMIEVEPDDADLRWANSQDSVVTGHGVIVSIPVPDRLGPALGVQLRGIVSLDGSGAPHWFG